LAFSIVTHSPDETFQIGQALGRMAKPGDVLLLQGPLGTGKTLLTQGLAKGLGITAPVTSPTFIIVNQYPGPLVLYHVDLYRIEATAEAIDLGLDDYFFGDGVCVVEWPERAPSAMPPEHLLVVLEHIGEHERSFSFQPKGSRYQALAEQLRKAIDLRPGQKAGGSRPHPGTDPPSGGSA